MPAGKVVADPVSTPDLAQTFCDYGRAPLDDTVQRELRDMIASRPDDAGAPLPQVGMA